eukprot:12807389-Alexandrium_andersonii.AAC.1
MPMAVEHSDPRTCDIVAGCVRSLNCAGPGGLSIDLQSFGGLRSMPFSEQVMNPPTKQAAQHARGASRG